MTDLPERVERIERLLGLASTKQGEGNQGSDRTEVGGHDRRNEAGGSLGDWVRAHKQPGKVVVGIAVSAVEGGGTTASHIFKRPDVPYDLKHMASLYQALASETRLAMLRELFVGSRSTAELMEAVGLDRGQLYHHLRDLFV